MTAMPSHPDYKATLHQLLDAVRNVVIDLAALLPGSVTPAEHWFTVLGGVRAHLEEDLCRVAVVGTVKSGKSTLINALLGRDVLKRGAGIVTAMITRLQPGPEPQARLIFKDWDEINGEVNRGLAFFPSPLVRTISSPLDLREARDRELLTQILAQVDRDRLVQQDSLDQNYVLLSSYVEGYPQLAEQLAGSAMAMELNSARLAQHQSLVSQESQAVFLKDVLLRLPFPWPAAGVELGDCQGSDSPIPQHLAQVQDYLLRSDLLIYVISSRVGLRRADYKFLSDLKRIRSWDHVLFVLNLDLNEFEHRDAVEDLRGRLEREFTLLYPSVSLFSFSALELLWRRMQAGGLALSPRDQGLLAAWEADGEMAALSRAGAEAFELELQRQMQALRMRLLITGCLEQMQAVTRSMAESVRLQQELLDQNLEAFVQTKNRLLACRKPVEGVRRALVSALKGVAEDLKKGLRKKIDHYFTRRHGEVEQLISGFIDSYQADLTQLELGEKLSAFMPGLYLVYQGFQRQVMAYLTEEINVRILEFVRQQGEWLQEQVSQLITPLLTTLQDAITRYYEEIGGLGIPVATPTLAPVPWTPPKDLIPRPFTLELGLGWKVRREAFMRLGINLVTETMERLRAWWKKNPTGERRQRLVQSLSGALVSMKKYAKQDLGAALLDYSEGMKFRYFFPLVDQLVAEQENTWTTALSGVLVDLEGFQEVVGQQEEQKHQRRERLATVVEQLQQIEAAANDLRAAAQTVSS